MVHIVAAIASNGVIGRGGHLPWRNPVDLRRFRDLTLGHVLVMGRRTFASIGYKPLPHRKTIVVSRTQRVFPGALSARSVDEAIAAGTVMGHEVFIAGGAAIYRDALPSADRLHLTVIEHPFEGDTRMPAIEFSQWQLLSSTPYPPDEVFPYAWSIQRYARRPA